MAIVFRRAPLLLCPCDPADQPAERPKERTEETDARLAKQSAAAVTAAAIISSQAKAVMSTTED